MNALRPGDKIYIPSRLHIAYGADDFHGGLCTVAGVYTPRTCGRGAHDRRASPDAARVARAGPWRLYQYVDSRGGP